LDPESARPLVARWGLRHASGSKPRQRGKTELARLDNLPAREWKTVTIGRSGRYRRPRLHEDMINPVRGRHPAKVNSRER
jgi:hypothetical protein